MSSTEDQARTGATPDEAEMQQMAAIAARHGNEILGPPPGQ